MISSGRFSCTKSDKSMAEKFFFKYRHLHTSSFSPWLLAFLLSSRFWLMIMLTSPKGKAISYLVWAQENGYEHVPETRPPGLAGLRIAVAPHIVRHDLALWRGSPINKPRDYVIDTLHIAQRMQAPRPYVECVLCSPTLGIAFVKSYNFIAALTLARCMQYTCSVIAKEANVFITYRWIF